MGEPDNLYSSPDDQRRPERLVPCGTDRVCLLETSNYDADKRELVAVDTDSGGVKWRKKAPHAEFVVPVGDQIMVRATSPQELTTVWRADGTQLLGARSGVGARIDGGNVLLFSKALSASEEDQSVAGLPMGSGDVVELGPMTEVRAESCSWNTTVMICGGAKNFVLRRFADG